MVQDIDLRLSPAPFGCSCGCNQSEKSGTIFGVNAIILPSIKLYELRARQKHVFQLEFHVGSTFVL